MACSGSGKGNGGPLGPPPTASPVILGLDPQPVRAGELISIIGENFSPGNSLRVLLDGLPVPIENSTPSSIEARIPLRTVPGTHGLSLMSEGKNSEEVDVSTSIFTVTGEYRTEGRVFSTGDCAVDPAQNSTEFFNVALVDSRPSVSIQVRGFQLSGDLFEVGAIAALESAGTSVTSFTVTLGTFEDGTAGFSGEFRYAFIQGTRLCTGWFKINGRRTTTQ